MPIGMIEGFDYYPDDAYARGIGVASTWIGDDLGRHNMMDGRFEGKGFNYYGAGSSYSVATRIVTASDKVGLGFAFRTQRLADYVNGRRVFALAGPNSSLEDSIAMYLWINNVGIAWLTVGGVEVARSTRQVLQNTWVYFEIELDIIGKRVRFLMDGLEQFNITKNTFNFVVEKIGRILITGDSGLDLGDDTANTYDDMYYVYDEAKTLGESRIQLGEALSNSTVQWTPKSGQNWQNIDDPSIDSDVTYNSTTTVGAKDTFNFTEITVNPDTIHAIGVVYAARKDDSGTRTIQSIVESGVATAPGFAQNLTTDYIWTRDVINKDPNGNLPWTKGTVNAVKIGYRLVQ